MDVRGGSATSLSKMFHRLLLKKEQGHLYKLFTLDICSDQDHLSRKLQK